MGAWQLGEHPSQSRIFSLPSRCHLQSEGWQEPLRADPPRTVPGTETLSGARRAGYLFETRYNPGTRHDGHPQPGLGASSMRKCYRLYQHIHACQAWCDSVYKTAFPRVFA
jgi:hypothetical protein